MKICAYVMEKNAKKTYAVESYDIRINAGMAVCIDILNRSGYQVTYAGKATVHLYDIVMVSITSDCDWWPFVAERIEWQHGSYKVVVGGQGVLNVRPFLAMVDYFVLGRAEGVSEIYRHPARTNRSGCATAPSMDNAPPTPALCVTCVYNHGKCLHDYNGAYLMNQTSTKVKCEGYLLPNKDCASSLFI